MGRAKFKMVKTDETLRILSFGAGVQSSTIALMAEHGEIPRFDALIFANTGWEPGYVIRWFQFMKTKLTMPVYEVRANDGTETIRDHAVASSVENSNNKRFVSIPYFTGRGGLGRRQCTNEFKIDPIHTKIRRLSGLERNKHAKYILAEVSIGISLDEIQRMKPATERWLVNEFPLIDSRMTRADCLSWMKDRGYQEPPKSACVGCPFHNDAMWSDMKRHHPGDFNDAVEVDRLLRDKPPLARKELQFTHRSLRPLGDVEFVNDRQVDMFGNECSGYCGT